MKMECDDLLSKRGSRLLADAIVEYWHERGYHVHAEGYPLDGSHSWGVRSNMVAGWPPKHLSLRA